MVEIDNQGNAVPDLAESFEAEPDASTWVFNLRKGIMTPIRHGSASKSRPAIRNLTV